MGCVDSYKKGYSYDYRERLNNLILTGSMRGSYIMIVYYILGSITSIELFQIDAPMYLKKEVLQAIQGEVVFNNMEYGFNGLTERK